MPIIHDTLFSKPFDVKTDWLEEMGLRGPTKFTFNRRKSCSTITGFVEDYQKLKNCIRYWLGASYVTDDGLKRLMRDPPARHPQFQSMFAHDVLDLCGIEPNGKETPIPLISLSTPLAAFAKYKKFRLEIAFDTPPYKIEDNDRVHDLAGGEFLRWTVIKAKPYVENIVMEGGQLVFDAPNEVWNGRPIMSSKPIVRLSKSAYSVTIYEVPLSLIAVDSGTYPRFDAAIGKLNLTTFLGKPPGTMMFDGAEVDVYTDPIETDLIGTQSRQAKVDLTFKHFQPTPLGTSLNTTEIGFNRVPAYDGRWYAAHNPDTGDPQFQYYEMNSLLTHWSL